MWLLRFLGLLGLCGLTACASIVSDNNSVTYFETVPEGARCELHGQDFTRVITAPASVQLPAEAAPITLACTAEGYSRTVQTVDTEMDGWIIGNILFGGLIGVAIDAARGAGQKFPPRVSVVLEPQRFANQAERDAWYGSRRADIEAAWRERIAAAQRDCSGNGPQTGSCATVIGALERARQNELGEIEERRLKAAITP